MSKYARRGVLAVAILTAIVAILIAIDPFVPTTIGNYIWIFPLPVLATFRFVLVVRDSNNGLWKAKSGLVGSLRTVGMIGLFLTALAAWIAAIALVVLMVKGDGAGIGAAVILFLLIAPYGFSELFYHVGSE